MNDGRKRKPQKHQNRTAYKITFDTQALQKQKKVSLTDLCVRCTQQIEWKLQYNKYKKMTEPSRCNICSQKTVYRTYMNACQPCVQLKKICAKCLTSDYEAPQEVKVSEKVQKQQQRKQYNNQIDFMKSLQERSRRTIRRNLEKAKISWDQEQQYFVDEEGNKVTGLHFRKGFTIDEDGNEHDEEEGDEDIMDEDDDMFGDDDMDEEQQQGDKKKGKNNTKKSENSVDNDDQQGQSGEEQDNQVGQDNKSDVEGDEVDCENDLDFDDEDWQDEDLDDKMDGIDIEDNQEEKGQKGKKGLSKKANKPQGKRHK